MATRWRGLALAAVAVLGLAACGGRGDAAAYPGDDITFVVPYGTGGSTDPIARQFARQMESALSTTVVVENREGGSATIGTSAVVEADPDGYMVGLSSNSALTMQPLLTPGLPYSSPADYQPIVKLADLPTVLAVRADAPWQTFEQFMDEVEANPGAVRVSVSGARTAPDLSVQELNRVAGVQITTVPFTGGGGESATALLSGQVEATAGYAATLKGQVDAGEVRVLAAFYDERYPVFPDAVPVVEAGYDVTLPAAYYFVAPKGLPEPVLSRLLDTAVAAVGSDEYRSFAEENGYILDPITTDQVTAELTEYSRTYEQLLAFIGQ